MAEVEQYIKFVLSIKVKSTYGSTDINYNFMPCTKEDFAKNGIDMETDQKAAEKMLKHRVCPNINKTDPIWEVINSYSDEKFRKSFSVMLLKCNPDYGPCKNETEIQNFLQYMFFTMFVVKNDLIFDDNAEVSLGSKEQFFLQF